MSDGARYVRHALPVLQAVPVLGSIAWALNLHVHLDLALYTEQLLMVVLGASLALTFLAVRRSKDQPGDVPWYDILAAALALGCCGYLALRYPELSREMAFRPPDAVVLSALLVGLLIEAIRRTAGLAFVCVVGAFFVYAMLGRYLPAGYDIRPVDASRLFVYLGVDTSGIIGTPLAVAVVVIVPFLLLGQLLSRCGGADFFTLLAMAVMGRYRGGAAKISVIASTLFGSISGSAVANVASTGVVTIPLMNRGGLPRHLSGGIEAVASTGGQLMPPIMGAAAFLMAEFLQIPYTQVLIAAIVPAMLYYAALFIQVDLRAARMGIQAVPRDKIPDAIKVLREGWYFPLPFVLFLVALVYLNLRAELAILLSSVLLIAAVLVFGYQGKRPSLADLWRAVLATGRVAFEIIVLCAAAGIVIGILNLTGLAFDVSLQLVALSGDNVVVLLVLAAAISVLLGMGMPTVGIYVLLAALVAPALVRSGIEPLVAHFFVLYFGMLSMVTPPIALAAFAAANIAGADFWKTAGMAVQLGWSAYVIPFVFVFSPALLLIGEPLHVAWTILTALFGVWFVSVAIAGYLRDRIGLALRVAFAACGLFLLTPMSAWEGALMGEIVGLVVGASLVLLLFQRTAAPARGGGANLVGAEEYQPRRG